MWDLVRALVCGYLVAGGFSLWIEVLEPAYNQSEVVRKKHYIFFILTWPLSNWQGKLTPEVVKVSIGRRYSFGSGFAGSLAGIYTTLLAAVPVWFFFFMLLYVAGTLFGWGTWLTSLLFYGGLLITPLIPVVGVIYMGLVGFIIGLLWTIWTPIFFICIIPVKPQR